MDDRGGAGAGVVGGGGVSARKYGNWWIRFDPPPIPTRACDWQFHHDDYDGAPDSGDSRCGHAPSLIAAMDEIDAIELEAFACTCSTPDVDAIGCMSGLPCAWRDDAKARHAARAAAVAEAAAWDPQRRVFAAIELSRGALGKVEPLTDMERAQIADCLKRVGVPARAAGVSA